MVGEIERNRCSRRSDPASPGTRRRGAGQRANRPAPGVRARKRATARTGTPDGFFSAFGDLHQRPRDARRRSSKDDSRHRDRTRLGLDCGGLLQSQWLQPESIPACGKHHQRDGGPVSLSVHVPGLKPGAEAGVVNLRIVLPEFGAQFALNAKVIQLQLDDGDRRRKIAPDIACTYMQSDDFSTLAMRCDHHEAPAFPCRKNSFQRAGRRGAKFGTPHRQLWLFTCNRQAKELFAVDIGPLKLTLSRRFFRGFP